MCFVFFKNKVKFTLVYFLDIEITVTFILKILFNLCKIQAKCIVLSIKKVIVLIFFLKKK